MYLEMVQVRDSVSDTVPHLNPFDLVIRTTPEKGRGVYASRSIPAGVTVDISPVLLFSKSEYQQHARNTIVDEYAFVWGNGQMALALGLGSIMNHSAISPNVSYVRDKPSLTLRYTTMRAISAGDELCIYYGANLWFTSAEESSTNGVASSSMARISSQNDEWDPVFPFSPDTSASESDSPSPRRRRPSKRQNSEPLDCTQQSSLSGPPDTVLRTSVESGMPTTFPLERFRFPDEQDVEFDEGNFPTSKIWAVDIANAKLIGPTIEYMRSHSDTFEYESLKHLKRIKRSEANPTVSSVAIAPWRLHATSPPPFPTHLASSHSDPAVVTVPASPATSQAQLSRKAELWPVGFCPPRDVNKQEKEWSTAELDWVREGLSKAVAEARKAAHEHGELPIGAYVAPSFSSDWTDQDFSGTATSSLSRHFGTEHDTRTTNHHPLRHVCMNIIRKVAGSQSTLLAAVAGVDGDGNLPAPTTLTPAYLLTSHTLFITHEPCAMCSMALLHSRVKTVFYVVPMPLTGGCGGMVKGSVPGLKGVNHRYEIWRWAGGREALGVPAGALDVDERMDI